MRLNVDQQYALLEYFWLSPEGAASYLEFRRRVFSHYGTPAIFFYDRYVRFKSDGRVSEHTSLPRIV
jgi:hypothetical protein